MIELYSTISAKWEPLGIFLGLDSHFLENIEHDHPRNAKQCLVEVLKLWLKQSDPEPSWSALVETLQQLDEEKLAQRIQAKYMPSN